LKDIVLQRSAQTICGLENIKRFNRKMGFLHPDKSKRLEEAINSYVSYEWKIPETREELSKFIAQKGRLSKPRKEIRFLSIRKNNLSRFKKALKMLGIKSSIFGPWKSNTCSKYYCLIIKIEEVS